MINISERRTNKLPGNTSLFVSFNYQPDIVNAIKTISSSVYDKNTRVWEVPITKLAELLDSLCQYDDINLDILPDNEEQADAIRYDIGPFKTPPFEYQKEGIQFALNHDKFLLLDGMGLGKSLQAIYSAQEIKKRDNIEHCLIICGVNTLKSNWKKEIQTHSNLDCMILGERVSKSGKVSIGSVSDRLEDLKSPIKQFFVITNIETLRNDDIVKEINKGANKFEMIVVDEVHHCKSPTSQQGKNLLKLKSARYKIGMTGTLLLNNPLDAFVPLKWLGVENATYTNFKYFYCTFGGPFNNILIGYKNVNVLKDTIEKYSLRRTKDLLDLPPKTIINEYVDMNDEQQKFYNNIKNGVKDQVDKVEMNTATILSLVGRLRQATACPSILTTESIKSSKIERAVDLASQIIDEGNKVVIFSTFKETLNPLVDELKEFNPLLCTGDIKDNIISENIDKFQNNDTNKVMLCTWQKMGTGVTLTAATYAIFLDTPWTAAEFQQCQDRIYRIGTTNKVFIYNLICKGTIDEHVKELVDAKEAISDFVIDNKISDKTVESLRKYIQDLD